MNLEEKQKEISNISNFNDNQKVNNIEENQDEKKERLSDNESDYENSESSNESKENEEQIKEKIKLNFKESYAKMQTWPIEDDLNISAFSQIINPPIAYPFELDEFQKGSILRLENYIFWENSCC